MIVKAVASPLGEKVAEGRMRGWFGRLLQEHPLTPTLSPRGEGDERYQFCGTSANRHDAGFTLVELLVSLTILALLLAMVPGTLRLGRRAWETPGQLDQASDELAALGFVQTHIKSAVPIFERDAQGVSRIAFSGGPQSLNFVVPLSGGPNGGGLYRIDLGSALRISLYQGTNASGQSALLGEDRALGNLSGRLQFRYFGPLQFGQVPLWHDAWPRTDRLPDLVEIKALPGAKSAKTPPIFHSEFKLRPVS